jgi:hypothetical protein
MLDAISAWKSLMQGNYPYWMGVFLAHMSFIRWIIQNMGSLGVKQPTAKPKGIYHGSIVWQYFILGKRYFSQIVKTN